MKKLLLILSTLMMVCGVAAADVEMSVEYVTPSPTPYIEGASPGGYLWDVQVGTPISEAVANFQLVTGAKLKAKDKSGYSAKNVLIKGLPFDFIVGEDENHLFDSLILRSDVELPYELNRSLSASPVTFSQCDAVLHMLMEKFGSPVSAYWSFGKEYPTFSAPIQDGSFDFELIIHASEKYNNSISVCWDHVRLNFAVFTKSDYDKKTNSIIYHTSIGLAISESSSAAFYPEIIGQYSEESLLLNAGITSF